MARRLLSLSLTHDLNLTIIGGGITKHISNAANAVGSASGGCQVTLTEIDGMKGFLIKRGDKKEEMFIPCHSAAIAAVVYMNEPDAAPQVKK